MSSDMNLSSLLQSELYCTPTQVILIDAIPGNTFVENLLHSMDCSESDFIDHIKVGDYITSVKVDSNASDKANYTKYRVPLLSALLRLFETRLAYGTKERCVIIVIGNVEDPTSRTCLIELPVDVSNLIFWKTGHLPGVIRMATSLGGGAESSDSSMSMKSFKTLLDSVGEQYFEMPRFEGETTTKRTSGDAQGAIATSIRPSNSHLLCINPYDILVCSSTLQPIERFFREILPLQQLEASYSSKHLSSVYGSGGSLYLVEGRLVSSVSGWRRADWLVLAQSLFLPRFWCLDDKKSLDEFINLFNYRHWISRFDGLEETDQSNLEIIAFPDSDRKTIKKALKNISSFNFQRRKRESGWEYPSTKLDSLSALKMRPALAQSKSVAITSLPSKSSSTKKVFDPISQESNSYRITDSHFQVFRELISFLNREENFSESLRVIRTHVRGHGGAVGSGTGMEEDYESHASTKTSPSKTRSKRLSPIRVRNSQVSLLVEASKCPADFDKLEGISLLGSGNKEEAIMKLERYRSYLEGEEQDRRLMLSQRGNEKEQEERNRQSARVWGEISGIYSACGNFKAAQLMAGKALELDSSLTTAQKTLVLAVGRTGESSFREEDWIFSFFASAKTVQMEEAASFYAKRTEKFPKNGFFWYGYAMLNFVVVRDYDQSSEPLFEKALELLPEEGRISEAYATYLFQTRSAQIMRIKELYEVSMQLDASNLVLRANSAAFLLFLRSAQLSRLEEGSIQYGDCEAQEVYVVKEENLVGEKREEVMEGFDEAQNFLESALFSVSLVDQHPQVYLECWFYVLCYTIERDRAIQALQYIKAALRKGIRARNWDMHMHIRFLRRNRLFDDNNTHWIPKLALVIADRHPFDILDDWKLWCSLKSDKLVLNLKLAPHSFRVCVSPSKRRDKKEEFSPPSFFKTKSAPLASMASSNHRLNSPTLNRSKARPKQTASSPFNAKSRTNRKLVSVSSVSPSTPETAATHDEAAKPNGLPAKATTTGPILRKAVSELTQPKISPMAASIDSRKISTTSVSKSTPTRTMKAEDEDDILNLLSTHSSTLSTPPASEPSSSIMAPAENVRRTNSRVASAGEKAPKRQTSGLTSSAGSVLFSESTAIPAAIRKTKSPPLSAPSVRNVAKTSTSRNTRSRASSPSVENTSMDVTPNEQVWERLMDKYKEEDDILNSLETSSSSKTTRSSRSPTQRNAPDTIPRPNSTSPTANFSEAVPKRPTRSASGTLPVPKRTKRV